MAAVPRYLLEILVGGMSNHCCGQDLIAGHLNARVHVGVCLGAVPLGRDQDVGLILGATDDVLIYHLNCINHSLASRPATAASSRSDTKKRWLLRATMLARTVHGLWKLQHHCCNEMPMARQASACTYRETYCCNSQSRVSRQQASLWNHNISLTFVIFSTL